RGTGTTLMRFTSFPHNGNRFWGRHQHRFPGGRLVAVDLPLEPDGGFLLSAPPLEKEDRYLPSLLGAPEGFHDGPGTSLTALSKSHRCPAMCRFVWLQRQRHSAAHPILPSGRNDG